MYGETDSSFKGVLRQSRRGYWHRFQGRYRVPRYQDPQEAFYRPGLFSSFAAHWVTLCSRFSADDFGV